MQYAFVWACGGNGAQKKLTFKFLNAPKLQLCPKSTHYKPCGPFVGDSSFECKYWRWMLIMDIILLQCIMC